MDANGTYRVLNRATSQLDRLRTAPAPARVQVDGRSLAQLLAFAAEYGQLISFYDLADTPDGDWALFFASDPSIALAMLAALDVRDIEVKLSDLLHRLRQTSGTQERFALLRRLLAAILRLLRILERGERSAEPLSRAVRKEIRERLAPPLRTVNGRMAGTAPERGLRLDLAGLSGIWGLEAPAAAAMANPTAVGQRDWIDQIIAALTELATALLASLDLLAADAVQALEVSLTQADHAPQASLYIAFIMLFRHAQRALNRFPERLVDFYYGTILRQDSSPAMADQLYLTFVPSDGVTATAVPLDTRFPAGVDEAGETVNYAPERSLSVYSAALASLRTLRVAQEPLLLPAGGNSSTTAPAQVLAGTVALSDKSPAITSPFPPFGSTQVGTDGGLVTTNASLGFAIASVTLLLAGGTRQISIGLTITGASLDAVMPMLEEISAAAGGIAPSQVLASLLQAGLDLAYSSDGSWVPVQGLTVGVTNPVTDPGDPSGGDAATSTDTTYYLRFILPPSAAAFTAPTDDSWAAAGLPVLLARLRAERVVLGTGDTTASVYPYAVLSGLILSGLSITVGVTNLTALTVETTDGAANLSQPIAPFDSPATTGATLSLSAPELFLKTLSWLELGLTWYGLPETSTGFQGYYKGYVIDANDNRIPPNTYLFDNATFKGALQVKEPGLWDLRATSSDSTGAEETTVTAFLFRTDSSDTPAAARPVLPDSTFKNFTVVPTTPPAYYAPADSRITLTLTQPSYAFGDTLYADNMMAASLQNTALVAGCSEYCVQKCAGETEVATMAAALDPVAEANLSASDERYHDMVDQALARAVQELNGAALKAVNDALDKVVTIPVERGEWRTHLTQSLKPPTSNGGRTSWLRRARGPLRQQEAADATTVNANLSAWIEENAAALGTGAVRDLGLARVLLGSARKVIEARAEGSGENPAVARPLLAAGVRGAKADMAQAQTESMATCMEGCTSAIVPTPNAPWLPQIAALWVNYSATSTLPGNGSDCFYHLLPFAGVAAVDWPIGATVPLLDPQPCQGTLYLGLSGAAETLNLLVQMAPGEAGWSSNPPPVAWAQAVGGNWVPITEPDGLQEDGTNGLQNTGIITIAPPLPDPGPDGQMLLRLSVVDDADRFPLLAGLVTNAVTAAWVGPGGAETLGTPLPAGTITSSDPPLDEIGSIGQPLASFGGRAAATGQRFHAWMAERLRHKERGIQGWDYARLVLADFPTLWQAMAIPAGQADDPAEPGPGQVRLVVVAGPGTPDISDATVPLVDPLLLAEVGELLATRISPFITLTVENPTYVRITVHAKVLFSDGDTVAAWTDTLNQELIDWLSPWPAPALGPRPADYYNDYAIGDFIRRRPYVRAILSLELSYDPQNARTGWHYLTSASTHDLSGETVSARAGRRLAAGGGA
ncbi:hypothetical protein GE253_13610 [Niveispirillum sp. SYP-B3756]|uniref:hypothetical protein n=1 Tax=Niveispirillum sp. SYP-B3756 TaxID=2662178 RepID=UPI001292B276|nr:hypothetical protein [Niveispirillum sp. SYP-B3756]MQP66376.1 hypothetical protein [Niveispirillum sp. SYP-B3756]